MKNNHCSKEIIIIGASGHAQVCMDYLQLQGKNIAGFCDDNPELKGKWIHGVPVLGSVHDYLDKLAYYDIFIGIGDNKVRKKVATMLDSRGIRFNINVIHPITMMSRGIEIGTGNFIAPGVVVKINTKIGNHVIINSNATISHDCIIGDYSQISPGCNITGNVTIEEGAFVGAGAVVIPGKVIGAYAVVGAGAVVINDIPPYCTAVGVPAKIIKHNRD